MMRKAVFSIASGGFRGFHRNPFAKKRFTEWTDGRYQEE